MPEIDEEYQKLKAEYAEQFAMRAAGAAMQLKTYTILLSEFENDWSGMGCISYDKDWTNKNAYVDNVHDQAARSSSSIERWKAGKLESQAVVDDAAKSIACVREVKHRQILELRYLDLLSWKQVARAVDLSESAVMHMRVPALASLYDYIPIEYKMPKHDAV